MKHVKIAEGLTEFPKALFDHCDTLEILDLSNNQLSSLPDDFGRFTKLKIAFFTNNHFVEFPKVLSKCPDLSMIAFKSNKINHIPENAFPVKLRWLILTDNKIVRLPKSIGNCHFLQKCALAGNQLTELPVEMANCTNLELLRISANNLSDLPLWLLDLPKLSWLGFSGNPFSINNNYNPTMEYINWDEIDIQEQLGEGASGHIYKALWKTKNKPVAIKVFKGAVTSDGYPSDELATCIATGSHQNLVPLLAQISNHPEKKQGIVMSLIGNEFRNLGNPPSLETCTRDTFEANQIFSIAQAINIISSVISATKHLHEKGILHGDLYAHNTLYREDGLSFLGDFGAASFYNKNHESAYYIEKIDVRAFGCLMEDVLNRTDLTDVIIYENLKSIMYSCLETSHKKRPNFDTLLNKLNSIKIKVLD